MTKLSHTVLPFDSAWHRRSHASGRIKSLIGRLLEQYHVAGLISGF